MSENLTIRLGSQATDTIHWIINSSVEDEVIASGQLRHVDNLSQLTAEAEHRNVIILLPGCDFIFKCLAIPGTSAKAIQQAAPYLLEDDLTQSVEQLFFAYESDKNIPEKVISDNNPKQDANCFLVAVDKGLMAQWQTWLAAADIHYSAMLPDILAMPHNAEAYSAINIDNQIIVRQGLWKGCTLDLGAWAVISAQWQAQNENNEEEAVHTISINAYSTLPDYADNLPLNPMAEELPLALMVKQLKGSFFNLLQGEFQPKKPKSAFIQNWLWAAVFLGCALLVNMGAKGIRIIELNAQQTQVNEKIVQTFKVAFPKSKRVKINNVRSQLKRELVKLGGSGSEQAGFLAMLSELRQAFSDVPELKPDSLKFDGKRQELRLQATSSDYKYFERFKNMLDKTSLNTAVGAQKNLEDSVTGSFTITAAGAGKSENNRRGK
jgi:general secretion pathway protein L